MVWSERRTTEDKVLLSGTPNFSAQMTVVQWTLISILLWQELEKQKHRGEIPQSAVCFHVSWIPGNVMFHKQGCAHDCTLYSDFGGFPGTVPNKLRGMKLFYGEIMRGKWNISLPYGHLTRFTWCMLLHKVTDKLHRNSVQQNANYPLHECRLLWKSGQIISNMFYCRNSKW